MSETFNYDCDMTYTVQVNRAILRSIGLWPIETESRITNILRTILIVVCFSLLIFMLTPYILYTFLKLEAFKARLKMIGGLFFYLMALVMYSLLALRDGQIRKCVRHVADDWRNVRSSEDRATMLRNVKNGRYVTIWAAILWCTSCVTYRIVLPLSRGRIVVNENITIRPLVHSNYYVFFDPQITPAYEIVFSVHCLSSAVIYSTAIGVCGLSAMFVMHACGQLEVLIRWINNLADGNQMGKYANIDRKLASIVDKQIRVRRFPIILFIRHISTYIRLSLLANMFITNLILGHSFINRVEGALRDVYLVEMVGCTFIICLLGYYMITEYEQNDRAAVLTYSLMLSSFTVNIFILCYIGEVLSEQGRKVNVTSCTTHWYRLPHQKARLLILVIAMSNYPMKITAGKLFDLSLMTFGAVIKTSMGYLNLLRTVTM